MIFSEAEASLKWCPMGLARGADPTILIAENRYEDGTPSKHSMCIGSWCMAWRWRAERDGQHREGYCGAFGNPEAV